MTNLKDYQLEIEKYIANEDWAKAYQICNKILSYDPENTTFIKLKRNIEKSVNQINNDAIKQQLNQLRQLIKDKKYAEYLKSIAPLQTYASQFPEISKNILKVKKLLDTEYQQKREDAFQEAITEIKKNKDHLNHLEIIQKLENFSKLGIHTNDVHNWIKKVKTLYIKDQIQKNKGLINSKKFEDILLFLLKLRKIDKDNQQILTLINHVNSNYKDFNIEDKKDFIFKTLEEIKTLYLTKKYEYCVELAERILLIDENNSTAQKYLTKAKTKSNIESEKQIVNSIYSYYSEFTDSQIYKEKQYIRI